MFEIILIACAITKVGKMRDNFIMKSIFDGLQGRLSQKYSVKTPCCCTFFCLPFLNLNNCKSILYTWLKGGGKVQGPGRPFYTLIMALFLYF